MVKTNKKINNYIGGDDDISIYLEKNKIDNDGKIYYTNLSKYKTKNAIELSRTNYFLYLFLKTFCVM